MRLVADGAGEEAGKTFVLRNVGGASGALAVQQVLRQPADGCTVLAGNVNAVILAPLLMPQAGFQPTDLVPLGQVGSADFLVVAAPGFAAHTLEELPAAARRAGRPLSAGHPGTETLQHLALPLIERRLQLPLLRVPYKGSSVLVNDLIGGHLDIAVEAAEEHRGLPDRIQPEQGFLRRQEGEDPRAKGPRKGPQEAEAREEIPPARSPVRQGQEEESLLRLVQGRNCEDVTGTIHRASRLPVFRRTGGFVSRLQGNPRFDARPLPATRATAAGDKAMIQKFLIKISPSRRILP
ncbi:MAG: hypothetical protein IIZ92_24185, partial [Aquincola sp.]|nr:hypothetical protein [Aquincola sp.]